LGFRAPDLETGRGASEPTLVETVQLVALVLAISRLQCVSNVVREVLGRDSRHEIEVLPVVSIDAPEASLDNQIAGGSGHPGTTVNRPEALREASLGNGIGEPECFRDNVPIAPGVSFQGGLEPGIPELHSTLDNVQVVSGEDRLLGEIGNEIPELQDTQDSVLGASGEEIWPGLGHGNYGLRGGSATGPENMARQMSLRAGLHGKSLIFQAGLEAIVGVLGANGNETTATGVETVAASSIFIPELSFLDLISTKALDSRCRSGCPQALSSTEKDSLVGFIKRDFTTRRMVLVVIQQESGLSHVSDTTIWKALKERRIKPYREEFKFKLKSENKLLRLSYCIDRKDWKMAE